MAAIKDGTNQKLVRRRSHKAADLVLMDLSMSKSFPAKKQSRGGALSLMASIKEDQP
jgi:hypothetical protein